MIFTGCEIVNFGIEREDADGQEFVPRTHLPVVEIVRRGDFHATGAEGRVHILIGDDGNRAFRQRQPHLLADEVLITRILRMHRHCDVAQHRLRSCRGHHQMAAAVFKRITDVPHKAVFFFRDHF